MNSMFSLMLTDTVKADAGDLMNNSLTFAERIGLGVEVLLFGMVVVFAVLVLIWAILALFRVIFSGGTKKENAEVKPEKVVETAPAPIPAEIVPVAESDDTELIAVITAAIAAVLDSQTDKPQTSFRVVSFRRTASK